MHNEGFVRPVRVNSDSTGMVDAVGCCSSLPSTFSTYATAFWLELPWITRLCAECQRKRMSWSRASEPFHHWFTYPDDYTFRCVSHYLITGLVCSMGMQSNDQMKISLIRVGLPLLAHIVARGLAEVQTAHRDFRNALAAQFDPVMISILELDPRISNYINNLCIPRSAWNSRHWVKWFLASVALALLDSDRLRRRLHFDPVKVQLKAAYFFQTLTGSDEYSLPLKLRVTCYLKE